MEEPKGKDGEVKDETREFKPVFFKTNIKRKWKLGKNQNVSVRQCTEGGNGNKKIQRK